MNPPMAKSPLLSSDWSLGSMNIAAKQAQIQDVSLEKKALLGSAAERRVAQTAQLQDTRLGETEALQDIDRLNDFEFESKYGPGSARARQDYLAERRDLRNLKNAERSTEDVITDSLIDAGVMAANTVGGAAALGASAADMVLGTDSSPRISEALGSFNDWARG